MPPTDDNDTDGIARRSLLKTASATAVGLTGVGTATGAVPTGPSFFGECEDGWKQAPDDFPFVDLRNSDPTTGGAFPAGAAEIDIYVHGWLERFARGGKNQGYTLETAFQQNGHDAPTVSALWNSNQPVWRLAKREADVAGGRLARWLDGYLDRYPDTTIRLVAHSLGTRVTLESLATLDGAEVVDNASFMGGAVNPDSVCTGTRYADGIDASASAAYNYHSTNDDVVCEYYAYRESTPGIGCGGAECTSLPNNYADEDVTDAVANHCDYGRPDVGCVPEIVANF